MADEDLTSADKPKGSNPKPVPKPGSLKPAGSGSSSKKNQKDYKSLTGRQKAAIFLISLGPEVSAEIMKHLREDEVETLTFEIDDMNFGGLFAALRQLGSEGFSYASIIKAKPP